MKSNTSSQKTLSRKKIMSLLHLLLKVKERAGILLELNVRVARNMVILLVPVARSFVIIVNNKDT